MEIVVDEKPLALATSRIVAAERFNPAGSQTEASLPQNGGLSARNAPSPVLDLDRISTRERGKTKVNLTCLDLGGMGL